MVSPLLRLAHNNFETNVKGFFNQLRNDQTLSDIMLVSDDDVGGPMVIPAHKVILAASSKFFSNLLSGMNQAHLLLYLRGITHQQLTQLLDFIYTGEVNVMVDDLGAFLSVASDLKIEGLTSTPPKQTQAGLSSTLEESISDLQFTFTPTQITPDIQASIPLPTSIDHLSTLPQSTSVFNYPEADLGEPMKTEPSDPSGEPSITYQSRSLVEKIKGSQGRRRVKCLVCGKKLMGGTAEGAKHVEKVHLKLKKAKK